MGSGVVTDITQADIQEVRQIVVEVRGDLPDNTRPHAPVAKLDKALVYETRDYRFESCRVRHFTEGSR